MVKKNTGIGPPKVPIQRLSSNVASWKIPHIYIYIFSSMIFHDFSSYEIPCVDDKKIHKFHICLGDFPPRQEFGHRFGFQHRSSQRHPIVANIATRPFFSSASRRRRKVFRSPSSRSQVESDTARAGRSMTIPQNQCSFNYMQISLGHNHHMHMVDWTLRLKPPLVSQEKRGCSEKKTF